MGYLLFIKMKFTTASVLAIVALLTGDVTAVKITTKNPVWNPPFNNWSVNQPSVLHDSGDKGDQDLELRDIIIDGVNGYDLVQTKKNRNHVGRNHTNHSAHLIITQ